MQASSATPQTPQFPPQHQSQQPGIESQMKPLPVYKSDSYKAAGKLAGKAAIITGGDSGIGRAVAIAFALEGCDVSIPYYNEHEDAQLVQKEIEAAGKRCLLLPGDVGDEAFCRSAVERTVLEFGKLDIVVNNAGEQHIQQRLEDITEKQLEATFRTNVFAMFFLAKAALPHLKQGASIINTTSVTAYRGNPTLIDYSATKGAIVSFTRSLSANLAEQGIRVNGVAPGPIWTPFIPSSLDEQSVTTFGADTPMKRAGQPHELAGAYVFLASDDASYVTGQVMHVNGGEVVNG
ncbi:SDR family oxidoreductase [Paenibacillus radicis (ex Gao et al. 2016)]|uniref:NAD(P)-dependent oxidoreductase n=1 Tax=Paenibacillus radicis (ex Gao et al. 2016) TaxID=1737354 RepID=A0A917M6S5_9BACL|nr:SDR family oxidoreductase [Paenibacillus radicis (ex Gao et al. 2016)]GGG82555.1 NAD(P)-dependent oxidoreductase [Paenibacillus radicis (ex Gao et al. 2016)]